MQFTSMDSWKAQMKRYAQERNIAVTDLQQRYVLEEFATKISKSKYKDEFVLKGGFVVANLLGFQEIISELRQSHIFNHNFEQYKNHNYPGTILTLDDIFEIFTKIQDKIQEKG